MRRGLAKTKTGYRLSRGHGIRLRDTNPESYRMALKFKVGSRNWVLSGLVSSLVEIAGIMISMDCTSNGIVHPPPFHITQNVVCSHQFKIPELRRVPWV